MKTIRLLMMVAVTLLATTYTFAQQGIGTNLPDRSSVLELKSGNRGLLIPRVQLEKADEPGPITFNDGPANSLLVFHTGGGADNLSAGYYYWVSDGGTGDNLNSTTGHWAAILTDGNLADQLEAGDGIKIEGNEISVDTDGANENQVLVTVQDDPSDPATIHTEWIDQSDLLKNIQAGNGVQIVYEKSDGSFTTDENDPDLIANAEPIIQLGGALVTNTTIQTDGKAFRIQTGDGTDPGENFFIDDLNKVQIGPNGVLLDANGEELDSPSTNETFDVLVVGDDGLVQKVSVADLVQQVVGAQNGLTWNTDDNKVELGGDLTKDTEISLSDNSDAQNPVGHDLTLTTEGTEANLKIAGLTEDAVSNRILTVDTGDNVRTVARSIIMSGHDFSAAEYVVNAQEVFMTAEVSGPSDVDITLPDATAAAGQVLNIKVSNSDPNTNTGYVVVKDGSNQDLVWGNMNEKSWVFKSNGTTWILIANN